jgi:hypothetical protein
MCVPEIRLQPASLLRLRTDFIEHKQGLFVDGTPAWHRVLLTRFISSEVLGPATCDNLACFRHRPHVALNCGDDMQTNSGATRSGRESAAPGAAGTGREARRLYPAGRKEHAGPQRWAQPAAWSRGLRAPRAICPFMPA